uniref:NADH-ubiquinone oxidoreductase chain 2 n=1 Tax=Heleodromia immaculata TaxID=1403662 RepID=A0A161FHA5_9MUSC|nr:NADH dehydrogenase subunit 2 [Heleodromia immaculata]
MFKNSSKILFYWILMIGTLLSISANSWLGAWMGLEINLLAFIPLMNDNNSNLKSTEASLKYFLTQALASSILLFSILIMMMTFKNNNNNNYESMIMLSSLFLKSGTAPFHFWFIEVMEGLSWINALILMTWQKIAPLMLISYLINKMFFFYTILISIIIGALGGLNQSSIRKIMAFSSINHLGWMLAAMMSSESLWMNYFMIYCLLTMNLVYFFDMFKLHHLSQLFSMFFNSKVIKLSMFINLLSLGGLPPFMGFLPKWMVIQYLTCNNQLILMTLMTIMSLITLYFYLRMTFSSFMMNYYESNWLINMNFNNFYMNMYLILSFISTFGFINISLLYFFF